MRWSQKEKHRLGIVKNADQILVLDEGKLVEQGTFRELTERRESFYYIWSEQAKWYHRNTHGDRRDR